MDIYLYNTGDETNKLIKVLLNETKLVGTLKEGSDVLSPSFSITLDSYPNFNYVYIPDFHRYYFITDIVNEYSTFWTLTLYVDVLMTYSDSIYDQKCIIARSSTNFNPMIDDNLLTIESQAQFYRYFVDTSLSDFRDEEINNNYVLTVINDSNTQNTRNVLLKEYSDSDTTFEKNTFTNYNNISHVLSFEQLVWAIRWMQDPGWLAWFTNATWLFSNPSDYIISIRRYPFDIIKAMPDSLSSSKYLLGLGDAILPLHAKVVSADFDPDNPVIPDIGVDIDVPPTQFKEEWGDYTYFIKSNCKYISRTVVDIPLYDIFSENSTTDKSFYHSSKYASISMYLPYIGYVDLNPDEVMGEKVTVFYTVDFNTGMATVFGVKGDVSAPYSGINNLFMCSGSISEEIPFGRDNSVDIIRNGLMQAISFAVDIAVTRGSVSTFSKVKEGGSRSGTRVKKVKNKKTGRMNIKERVTSNSTVEPTVQSGRREVVYKDKPAIPTFGSVSFNRGGSASSNASIQGGKNICVTISLPSPTISNLEEFTKQHGRPLYEFDQLNRKHNGSYVYQGYLEVDTIHLENITDKNKESYATDDELAEIEEILTSGIILPYS